MRNKNKMSAHRCLKYGKKRFEQIEQPAKLLNYFIWSNESNINELTDVNSKVKQAVK